MAPVRTDIKFTYAEYRTLPETGPRHQVVEGELLLTPAPSLRHQRVAFRVADALYHFVEGRALGTVVCSPVDVILSDTNVVQPDIVYVSNARRSALVREGIRGIPDLCVEILSGGTEDLDRGAKRLLYARFGVTEYWIVDPEANTVEVYRLQENASTPARRFAASDALVTALLPGLSIALSDVFAA